MARELTGLGRAARDHALACARVSVARGPRTVLADVTFELPAGEILSIVGPNGSGKTTLMLALLGLLPISSGRVLLAGHDVRTLPPRARARRAAYVPQGQTDVPAFRVRDIVAGGRYAFVGPAGRLSAADEQAVDAAIARFGLGALAGRAFNGLSGGERQKTLIAAALAQDPEILCLDEPNTALDPAHQVELLATLRDLHADGRTIILVSHDLRLPAALGGLVLALRAGRVAAFGRATDVLVPDSLSLVYGAPFVLAALPTGEAMAVPAWRHSDG